MSENLDNTIRIDVPALSEYVSVVRLAISGLASRVGFTIEDIEDIKIAVSEGCTNAVQHAYEHHNKVGRIFATASVKNDSLIVDIADKGEGFDVKILGTEEQIERSEQKLGLGLGLTFIRNLMDQVEIITSPGEGTTIRMTKAKPKLEEF